MKKRKFPLVNIILLAAVVIVLVTVNRPKALPDARNCSYLIDGEVVKLVDGRSDIEIEEGAASRQVTEFIISAGGSDLNGDGRADSAVFLRQNSGGSGTFYYAAAAFDTGKGYSGSNAVFIGDRIEPVDIEFEDEVVIISWLDRAEGESFSVKPSVEKSMRLFFNTGRLRSAE